MAYNKKNIHSDPVIIEKRPEHPVKSTSTMKTPSPLRSEGFSSDISDAPHTKPAALIKKEKAWKGCWGC
ncbi:hypothetical protein N7467_011363 [Penicillium canescens]|nr:hypothetical protein N7467_011363 [Penicillium canescens]